MAEQKGEWFEQQLFLGMLIGLAIAIFLLVKPLLSPILGGVVLAYLFHPLYKRLLRILKLKGLAAFLTLIIVAVIIFLPMGFVLNGLLREVSMLYRYSASLGRELAAGECSEGIGCTMAGFFQRIWNDSNLSIFIRDMLNTMARNLTSLLSSLVTGLPWFFLSGFILVFSTYIFLKEGDELVAQIREALPLKHEFKERMMARFKEVSDGVVYGALVVAIVQGFAALLAFWLFGVQAPFFWSIVVFFVSIMPFIATPVVFLPMGLFKLVVGINSSEPWLIFSGIMLILWGTVVMGLIDSLLRYRVAGSRSNLHPMLALVGMIGGVKLLGIVGLFFGPILLAFGFSILETYRVK